MNTGAHSPACRESPHFCICTVVNPGHLTAPGEKPAPMNPLTVDTFRVETLSVVPEDKALPGNYIELPGGWCIPKDQAFEGWLPAEEVKKAADVTIDQLPPLPYPEPKPLPTPRQMKLEQELHTAVSSLRFWRGLALVLASFGVLDNVLALGRFSGWW